ncbi:MAG: hypothetical protein AAGA54_16150 [Myxococcota bacterium]
MRSLVRHVSPLALALGLSACADNAAVSAETESETGTQPADTESGAGTSGSSATTMGGTAGGTTSGKTETETSNADASTTTDDASTSDDTGGSTGEPVEVPVGASGAWRYDVQLSFFMYDMAAHPDGGVVVAGMVDTTDGNNRDAVIAHVADDGTVQWSLRKDAVPNEQFFSVVVAGETVYGVGLSRRDVGQGNTNQVLISEFDLDGSYAGSVLFGSPTSDEHAYEAVALSNGGLAISGYTDQTGFGDRDGLLMVLDEALALQWAVGVGGAFEDSLFSLTEDDDGGLLGVGLLRNSAEVSGNLVTKYDTSGSPVFTFEFGNGGFNIMRGIAPLDGGRYLIVGQTSDWGAGGMDGYFGVLEPQGDPVVSLSTLGGAQFEALRELIPLGDDRFAVAGQAGSVSMTEDAWLLRLDTSDVPTVDFNVVYDSPRNQRMVFGVGAARADGGLSVGLHDVDESNDMTNEPVILHTDSLGGLDQACPTQAADAFAAVPVEDIVTPGTTVSQGSVNFSRTTASATDEPFVAFDWGTQAALCE